MPFRMCTNWHSSVLYSPCSDWKIDRFSARNLKHNFSVFRVVCPQNEKFFNLKSCNKTWQKTHFEVKFSCKFFSNDTTLSVSLPLPSVSLNPSAPNTQTCERSRFKESNLLSSALVYFAKIECENCILVSHCRQKLCNWKAFRASAYAQRITQRKKLFRIEYDFPFMLVEIVHEIDFFFFFFFCHFSCELTRIISSFYYIFVENLSLFLRFSLFLFSFYYQFR